MSKYTLEEYVSKAERFSKMSFANKIKTVRENTDILILGADGNWWGVKVKDKEIQEQLEDNDNIFRIENEWGSSEMYDLVDLLGIGITDI